MKILMETKMDKAFYVVELSTNNPKKRAISSTVVSQGTAKG